MTIPATPSEVPYAGDDVSTTFPIPFVFDTSADITVILTDPDGTPAEITTGFSITGGGGSTGTLELDDPLEQNYTLTILDDPELTQPTDYPDNDAFPASAHEAALDRVTRQVKRLHQRVGRSLRVRDGDGSAGTDLLLPIEAARAGKFMAFDADGNPTTSAGTGGGDSALRDDIASSDPTADGARLVGYIRTETGAVGRSLYSILTESISALDFGMSANGATINDSLFQAAINAAAGVAPLRIPKGASYYRLTSKITAPANTHIILEEGAELRWTATTATGSNFLGVATRPGIEVEGDNFRIEGRGTLRGPSSGAYVTNETCIYMFGTDTDDRASGLHVGEGVEMIDWGSYGVLAQFTDNISVIGAKIHELGYIGILAMSCNHGRVHRCTIGAMVGNASEMHCISLSNDETGYSSDPNASSNPRATVNPFCADWDIAYNTCYDQPTYTAIDAHGAFDTSVHHNKIYNCRRAIQIASGSNGALNYAGEANSVCFNTITPKQINGDATTVVGSLIDGITVNGGVTVLHTGVRVIGNDIEGCGSADNVSASITAARTRDCIIMGNTIRNWAGPGIYTFDGDGCIQGNSFDSVNDATTSRCIFIDTSSFGTWTITGNNHNPRSGTPASEGLRISSIANRHIIESNNFDAASAPYVGTFQTLSGSGAVSLLTKETRVVTTGSAAALTLANGVEGQEKFLVMTTDGGGDATLTPANLINGSTITFNDVGDSAFLRFIGGEWCFMGGTATLA
jgi:hypothetical protein